MVSTQPRVPNSGHQYFSQPTDASATRSPNQELLPLTAQVNNRDHLEIGGCDLTDLVQQWGSPLYVLDEFTLREACRQYRESLQQHYPGSSLAIYASKAWNCLAVCGVVASEGLGIDVVSGGELYTALQAGINSEKIYFHGNNKSSEELQLAIENNCKIVVDNWLELQLLESLAQPAQIMLRLTPGIECHTHEYIRTGHLDSKFGFDPNQVEEVFAWLKKRPQLECIGLHAHIGSQIFERQPHQDLAVVLVDWFEKAKEFGLPVSEVNIGGGLGIRYTEDDDPPSIDEWVGAACRALVEACEQKQLPLPKLIAEPGRSLIGPTCVTAYTVGSRKEIPGIRNYISIDGGMSDNPRPITYQSIYRTIIANRVSATIEETVTIAGKHCESGDILVKDALLPTTKPGDILVVMGTGAYNYSMASNYNRVPRPAAVLVNEGQADLIIKRETYADLVRQDCLPERLVSQADGNG